MAAWTQTIGNTVLAEGGITVTEDFVDNNGLPMYGGITLSSHQTMLESKPSQISYNVSLEIPDETPMNLRVDEIRFVFTSTDFAYQPSDEIDVVAALSRLEGILEVVNATSVTMRGSLQIIPKMPQGEANGFLGCIIYFHYWDYGLPPPPSNGTSGDVAVIQLIPFTIIPAYLEAGNWFFAMEGCLLVWVVLIIYFVCSKTEA